MSDFLNGIAGITGFFGLVTLIVLGIVNSTGQGATFRERILSSPSLSPLLIVHYFLPYGLIILVLFVDIMSQLPQGVWSLLIGGVAMALNWFIGYTFMGGAPDFANDLCEIPGLKGIASKLMPQNLLFITTIVTYLATFVTMTTEPAKQTSTTVAPILPSQSTRVGGSWGLAVSVILIQLFGILSTPGCLVQDLQILGITLPPSTRAILSVLAGLLFGGLGGFGMSKVSMTQPSYGVGANSVQTQSTGPGFVRESFQLGTGLGEIPIPPSVADQTPVDMAKSSGAVTPGESSDQFVCEAYKNGQLVSSTFA